MDREQLQRRLMTTYLEEVDEHVRALDRDLLALETAAEGPARQALVNVVFRAMHSLKGASRAVSVATVERACHALEHKLAPVREASEPLAPGLIELLFAAVDALRDAAGRLRDGGSLAGTPIEALAARLTGDEVAAPASSASNGTAAAASLPPPGPPGAAGS